MSETEEPAQKETTADSVEFAESSALEAEQDTPLESEKNESLNAEQKSEGIDLGEKITIATPEEKNISSEVVKKNELKAEPKIEIKKAVSHAEPQIKKPSGEVVVAESLSSKTDLEIEIDILLDRKRLSLTEVRALAEGQVIILGGSDFKATLILQGNMIAEAQLIMVDGHPSVQITKVLKS